MGNDEKFRIIQEKINENYNDLKAKLDSQYSGKNDGGMSIFNEASETFRKNVSETKKELNIVENTKIFNGNIKDDTMNMANFLEQTTENTEIVSEKTNENLETDVEEESAVEE